MHSEPAIEAPASPVPAIVSEPVVGLTEAPSDQTTPPASPGPRHPVRFVLAKVLGALRGDRYMVGAYPPDSLESASSTRHDEARRRGATATARDGTPASPSTKER